MTDQNLGAAWLVWGLVCILNIIFKQDFSLLVVKYSVSTETYKHSNTWNDYSSTSVLLIDWHQFSRAMRWFQNITHHLTEQQKVFSVILVNVILRLSSAYHLSRSLKITTIATKNRFVNIQSGLRLMINSQLEPISTAIIKTLLRNTETFKTIRI